MDKSVNGLRLAADAAIDLHLHTTYSDGTWTPEPLLDHLLGQGFGLAAISDHDRTDKVAEIQALAREKRLPVLAAVEMTCAWRGEMVDLLCYGFDAGPGPLADLALDLLHRQQENTRAVFGNLLQQGYDLPPEALALLLATPSPEQPHALLDLLKEHGYGLGDPPAGRILGQAGCNYAMNEPAAVVEAAHRSGATCLLAHPGHGDGFVEFDIPLLDQFRRETPVDGLEVHHPIHTPAMTEMYREYAEKHRLLVSAGSDSHGPDKPPIKYPAELCRLLLERVGIQVG
jgi:predicted metal-dependent phosphoesterase TrpH